MRLKTKFRPNLPPDPSSSRPNKLPGPRVRKVSGTTDPRAQGGSRVRTISGCSNPAESNKEKEIVSTPATPPPAAIPSSPPAPATNQVQIQSQPQPPPPPPPPQPHLSPILKSALTKSPDRLHHHRIRHPSGRSASVETSQSLSPNFLHSPPQPPPTSPGAIRQRRLTETSTTTAAAASVYSSSVYDRRKADHKRKFTSGIPERRKMTMFDLIYYNPIEGHRMSNSSSRRNSRASSISEESSFSNLNKDRLVPDRLAAVKERLEEEMMDDVVAQQRDEPEDEDDEKMPVPQVKVGPNGEIIVDEESTVIETSAAKKAKEELLRAPLVFENAATASGSSNYGSWGKKRKNVDWSDRETVRFYKALSVFGTDFSMMESVFKRRSRHDLKMKFKREERGNRGLVDKHLREGLEFDPKLFESDDDDDTDDENEENRRRRKRTRKPRRSKDGDDDEQPKKVRRKRRTSRYVGRNRGYYSSSEDADSEMPEQQEQEAASGQQRRRNPSRRSTAAKDADSEEEDQEEEDSSSPMLKNLLEEQSGGGGGVNFPPGLLAANPGLANAMPGSLVVVASPSKASAVNAFSSPSSSPSKKPVKVYNVSDDQEDEGDGDKS